MFKSPFSFNGRIRRSEYALGLVIIFFALVVFGTLSDTMEPSLEWDVITMVFWIPVFWFFIAQRTKRCHDRSVSGAWQIIPFYGWILLFAESDPGDNEYGPNPKGIERVDDWDPTKRATDPIDNVDGDGIIIEKDV
ncbi:MAG: DUF805 domain-containing protein [Pedobacter sp.]|nr:MAG: DUF805 domain-containing protein [Pedobacter sp.]